MKRIYGAVISIIVLLAIFSVSYIVLFTKSPSSTFNPQQHLNHIITSDLKHSNIPGVSVLVMKNNEVLLNKGYGYANIDKHIRATKHTRYEIASNTKAFTGLAILQLAQEGKLKLTDSVSKYLPKLNLKYDGQRQKITIKQLLSHTSGISGNITSEDTRMAKHNKLNDLIPFINGKSLNHKPGDTFEYSNMNYDLLGLIIQDVSHQSYRQYMTTHWFKLLAMQHTQFKTSNHKETSDATGYVFRGRQPEAAQPEFNYWDTPAAYMLSSTSDLEQWLRFQLNPPAQFHQLIQQSHQTMAHSSVEKNADAYGAGWYVNTTDHFMFHAGTLDHFSSFILIDPQENYGFVILANMNSNDVQKLANHLNTQLSNHGYISKFAPLINQHVKTLVIINIIVWALILLSSNAFIYRLYQVTRGQYVIHIPRYRAIINYCLITALVVVLVLLYSLPYFLLGVNQWSFLFSWLPTSAKIVLWSSGIAIILMASTLFLFINSTKYHDI